MKNLFCIFILLSLTMIACDSPLDIKPYDRYEAEFVFADRIKGEQYVVAQYDFLPYKNSNNIGYNRINSGAAMIASASDEAMPNVPGLGVEVLTNGSWNSSSSNPDALWNENYQFIRAANLGLENLHMFPSGYEDVKNIMHGELIFMRAYAHFELMKRYGGIPIITKVLKLEDDLNIPRNTFEESVDFIAAQLDTAIKYLPSPQDIAASQTGRSSKGTAMALKSRVLLYAASDLYNGPGFDGTTNPLIGYGNFSGARWEKAARAAADVIALNYYRLYKPAALTDVQNDATARTNGERNYSELFFTLTGNLELIMIRTSAQGNQVEKRNTPVGYTNGQGTTNPSQQMVDAYGMLNGKGIAEDGSGYNPLIPYANRDPRFNSTLFFNGKIWSGRAVETFVDGLDNRVTATNATKTGYYLSKFMKSDVRISGSETNTFHCFPIIRYAEILLNYAEAVNEAYGPDADPFSIGMTARQAVQEIRGRVLRPMYAVVPASVNEKVSMREFIRNERRVELAFEDHRHLDVRRWKTAPQTLGVNIQGMRIIKDGTELTYELVPNASARVFGAKMYLYPIPKGEMDKNKALAQNPLW
jgi:starch-binding outer membrane protein, SusD/RagB family